MSEQDKKHVSQNQGFKITSGVEDTDGNIIGYRMLTDESVGFTYYKDGTSKTATTGTSLEVCGENITDTDTPGKVIYSKNGNIHLEAVNGDIVIKAKNIRFVAQDGSGEITFTSTKHFQVNAPICKLNGTNTTISGSSSVSIVGTSVESTAQISNTSTSTTDVTQGSLLGQLTAGLKKLKKFLEDCL